MLKNLFGHFGTVIHHKWVVFTLCCRAGIPLRGFVHDISKFSPTEFFYGVKYYAQGKKSPINLEKKDMGYSNAWLHHKGRNKHHPEYWYDTDAPMCMPIIPYKYICEMICDQLAAGIVYQGKKWTKEYQLSYWENQRTNFKLNDRLKEFETIILTQVANKGIKDVITKQNLKQVYDKCISEEYSYNK